MSVRGDKDSLGRPAGKIYNDGLVCVLPVMSVDDDEFDEEDDDDFDEDLDDDVGDDE